MGWQGYALEGCIPGDDNLISPEGILVKSVPGRVGGWIQTSSGGRIWPLDPRPEEINIEDIAHALSNQCRFGGHVRQFYSVAQHCVLVSWLLEHKYGPDWRLSGLLHDAAEAYLVDLPRPIKYSPDMAAYIKAERNMERCLAERFGLALDFADRPEVKWADRVILRNEQLALMPPPHDDWDDPREPEIAVSIDPWDPEMAKEMYLTSYRELTN